MTVPTQSDMVLQPQVAVTKPSAYADFCLPDAMNTRWVTLCMPHPIKNTLDGNLAAILEMDTFSSHYSARTYGFDRVNGKMNVMLMRSWIAISKRASLYTFPSGLMKAGSYKHNCQCVVGLWVVLSATESMPYDEAPAEIPRSFDIIPIDVRIQEEYFNLHARYLTEIFIQATLAEGQQEIKQQEHDEQEVGELQLETDNFL